jgi:hypothetical protein
MPVAERSVFRLHDIILRIWIISAYWRII